MQKQHITHRTTVLYKLWRRISRERLSRFSSNLKLKVPHPKGIHAEKFCVFPFRECRATDVWKWCFLYSCKIYPCLLCTLDFLSSATHYRVSWYHCVVKATHDITLACIGLIALKFRHSTGLKRGFTLSLAHYASVWLPVRMLSMNYVILFETIQRLLSPYSVRMCHLTFHLLPEFLVRINDVPESYL